MIVHIALNVPRSPDELALSLAGCALVVIASGYLAWFVVRPKWEG